MVYSPTRGSGDRAAASHPITAAQPARTVWAVLEGTSYEEPSYSFGGKPIKDVEEHPQ